MKVKEIVVAAAKALGIEKGISDYLSGVDATMEREEKLLENCFNLVECGLALDYLPLYAEDTLRTTTERLEYSSFTYPPVRVLSVTDLKGNPVAYTVYSKYLKVTPGTLRVVYTYTPAAKEAEDESDFGVLASKHLLVYGVLAEYCLAEGRMEEAAEWDKKYKAAIKSAYHERPCQRLSSRRWV